MRYRILGPLTVEVDGQERSVPGNRDRIVLAMLLVHANQVVTVDRLVDALWPDGPPQTARAQIHSCVSRLRAAATIHSRPAGYLAAVTPNEFDLTFFIDHIAEARDLAAQARWSEADDRYRDALDLWRGDALAGMTA